VGFAIRVAVQFDRSFENIPLYPVRTHGEVATIASVLPAAPRSMTTGKSKPWKPSHPGALADGVSHGTTSLEFPCAVCQIGFWNRGRIGDLQRSSHVCDIQAGRIPQHNKDRPSERPLRLRFDGRTKARAHTRATMNSARDRDFIWVSFASWQAQLRHSRGLVAMNFSICRQTVQPSVRGCCARIFGMVLQIIAKHLSGLLVLSHRCE
jgi:hypothetical protein